MADRNDEGPPDVDATMKPLLHLPGVVGYMVVNEAGIPVKWSQNGFDGNTGALGAQEALSGMPGETEAPASSTIPASVTHYAALVSQLVQRSQRSCRKLFGRNNQQHHHHSGTESLSEEMDPLVQCLRLRTAKKELIIAPGDAATLVVIQEAQRDIGDEPEEEQKKEEAAQ
eukprot:gb/GECG01009224.1/.p1 GENE.gb/GECG01009224.1/~~gb/GECG01009224.1/.p1  ORF type:complete len:171 (+),score=34.82 gb/GECG01009224.1/:1-513(+)